VVIVDDPTNPEQAASEVERETANRFFRETLSTRLNNPETGVFVVVQQRLHENDLTGYLLTNEEDKWFHVCLPAELTPDVSPVELRDYYLDGYLFPQRFTHDFLSRMRTRLGSYGYAGQMLQRPTPPEGGIIKGRWFKRISMDELYRVLDTLPSRPGATQSAVFADTAYTAKQNNDPSALMACVYAANTLYIINVAQIWKELPDLLIYVPQFLDESGFPRDTPIRIEPKAAGQSIEQSLRKTGYNAVPLPAPKDDKITRTHAAAPFLEAQRCVLVEGPWVSSFLHECEAFPNGHHDDQVDVLTAAVAFFTAKPTVQRTHGSQRI
jgi:predicted phage terminase large subunit-like protein